MMDKVVDKIFEEQCFGILLCAVESGARWFYKMQFISFYWIDLPNDVSILQLFSGTEIPAIEGLLFRIIFFNAYDMEPDVIEECNKYALPSFQV